MSLGWNIQHHIKRNYDLVELEIGRCGPIHKLIIFKESNGLKKKKKSHE